MSWHVFLGEFTFAIGLVYPMSMAFYYSHAREGGYLAKQVFIKELWE